MNRLFGFILCAGMAIVSGCSEQPAAAPETGCCPGHEVEAVPAAADSPSAAEVDAAIDVEAEPVMAAYRDKTGFAIEFPPGWEVRADYAGTNVTALRPPGEAGEPMRESVSVVVERLPRGVDLERYLRSTVINMALLLTDMSLLEDERTGLAGRRAARLVYDAGMEDVELRNMLVVVFDGDRVFNITCSMLPETFERYQPVMDGIVSTFRLE